MLSVTSMGTVTRSGFPFGLLTNTGIIWSTGSFHGHYGHTWHAHIYCEGVIGISGRGMRSSITTSTEIPDHFKRDWTHWVWMDTVLHVHCQSSFTELGLQRWVPVFRLCSQPEKDGVLHMEKQLIPGTEWGVNLTQGPTHEWKQSSGRLTNDWCHICNDVGTAVMNRELSVKAKLSVYKLTYIVNLTSPKAVDSEKEWNRQHACYERIFYDLWLGLLLVIEWVHYLEPVEVAAL